MKKYLQKKNQLRYQKFLVYSKIYNYFKNMIEESISQEFQLKNIDETRQHFREEIEQSELMNRKQKKVCIILNYIEHFLVLASTITGYILISAFAFLLVITIGVTRSAIGLKICAIAAEIKKCKSKKQDKIVLLA